MTSLPAIPTAQEFQTGRIHVSESGCWEWTGRKHTFGYGMISVSSKEIRVHRLMYELWVGPIPDGYVICHKCDNPACCNPGHLFAGTQAQNLSDMWAKGRGRSPIRRNSKNPNCKISDEAVREIRALASLGVPNSKIARQFGCSSTHVRNIVTRKFRNGDI